MLFGSTVAFSWCSSLLKSLGLLTLSEQLFFLHGVKCRPYLTLTRAKKLMRAWKKRIELLPSLSPSVPTGGHQPHDSVSLPTGPSVIPPLKLLCLSSSLSCSASQCACDRTCRRQDHLLKATFLERYSIFRHSEWCAQWFGLLFLRDFVILLGFFFFSFWPWS